MAKRGGWAASGGLLPATGWLSKAWSASGSVLHGVHTP